MSVEVVFLTISYRTFESSLLLCPANPTSGGRWCETHDAMMPSLHACRFRVFVWAAAAVLLQLRAHVAVGEDPDRQGVRRAPPPPPTPTLSAGEASRIKLVAAQRLYVALQYRLTAQPTPGAPGLDTSLTRSVVGPPTGVPDQTLIPEVVDETHTKAAFEQLVAAVIAFIAPSVDEGLDLEGKIGAVQASPDGALLEQLQEVLQFAQDAVVARAATDKDLVVLSSTVASIEDAGHQHWPSTSRRRGAAVYTRHCSRHTTACAMLSCMHAL